MAREGRPWEELTPRRIKALREALGLTQTEFGKAIGEEARLKVNPEAIALNDPPQEAISRWEVGPGELYGGAILRLEARQQRISKFEEEVRDGA